MFLHELTSEQQQAFLVLARQVIEADERLAMQELELLERLYREMDRPAETSAAPDTVGDLNYMFESARVRAVVVLELLRVAHADGHFADQEHAFIRDIAGQLDLGDETWDQLMDWTARRHALLREGRLLGAETAA